MVYKIGICDDEINYSIQIEHHVKAHFKKSKHKYVVTLYHDTNTLFHDIYSLDVLFLDIEMGEINGIDIKNQLSKISNACRIIFVTNHAYKMPEAFGKNVYGFILKTHLEKIDMMLTDIEKEENEHKIITIADICIDTYDILYAKASGSYTTVFTLCREWICCMYLSNVLKKINGESFMQIHRSYIVNMKYIKNINREYITLANNIKLPISRKYRGEVSVKYFAYIRGRSL